MNLRPPLPPFTEATASQKVQLAEDGWNSRNPERVALACTEDTEWRNRTDFLRGRLDSANNAFPNATNYSIILRRLNPESKERNS